MTVSIFLFDSLTMSLPATAPAAREAARATTSTARSPTGVSTLLPTGAARQPVAVAAAAGQGSQIPRLAAVNE